MNLKSYLKISLLCLLTCLFLTGCVTLQQQPSQRPSVEIAKNQWITLPQPSELGLNVSATQILTAHYGKKTYTSQVQAEITPRKIVLVSVAGWGGTLFTIDYDGSTIRSTSLPIPAIRTGIDHTLTDFIFTYAPSQLIRDLLKSTDITLELKPHKRIFVLEGKPVFTISYQDASPWKGKILIRNFQHHYTISITTITP